MSPPALLIPFLLACGRDPLRQDVEAYGAAMEPVLAKNLVLAQGFLDVASKVKKGETDGLRIAERMDKELVPLADELRADAGKIQPSTPALADAHAMLVKAWEDRSTAYHAMSDAWARNDVPAFDVGRKQNVQSKLDEEKYFQAVNGLTEPYGVVLDQYP